MAELGEEEVTVAGKCQKFKKYFSSAKYTQNVKI
jgi:hypothetical protein